MRLKKIMAGLDRAFGLRSLRVRYHRARWGAARAAMTRWGTETTMPVGCSRRFQHHLQALRRLGFVVGREFALSQHPVSGPERFRAFAQSLRVRFPDGEWSCAVRGTRVVVLAPPDQMAEWERFLSADAPAVGPSKAAPSG